MASAFTHAFVGAALASLAPGTISPKRRVALAFGLAVLAVLPDADVVGFFSGIPYGSPLGHRGFSHSIPFAFLIGIGTWGVLLLKRRRAPMLVALAFAATLSHGLLDATTNAGLGVGFLVPFDNTRHFFPWRPLRTSPLNPAAFFSPSGIAILINEARWVVLPTLIMTALILGGRAAIAKDGKTR